MRLGIDASNIRAGGGVTHLVELLCAAQPEMHRVSHVTVWSGGRTLRQLPSRPWLDAVHHPALDNPLPQRLLWQAIRLPQLAVRACDLLFVPGGTFTGSFRPFVVMSQNLLPFDPQERRRYGVGFSRLRLHVLEQSQACTFERAAGLIFLTNTARELVERRIGGFAPPVIVIPHGVADSFRRAPVSQQPLSAYSTRRPFHWLYVSTVSPYKHQWQVADAVARLRAKGLPVALDLVGPADTSAFRRLQVVLARVDPTRSYIRYHGAVAYEKLPKWYHDADGFIFASSCETISSILVEAMASGLPIACSQRSVMPEVLGDAGQYFDPEQPDSIASALETLMLDPALRGRHALAAYRRAQRYSWERCAHETFSFLASVAEGYLHPGSC